MCACVKERGMLSEQINTFNYKIKYCLNGLENSLVQALCIYEVRKNKFKKNLMGKWEY